MLLASAPEVNPDLWRVRPDQGDRFLLCSDGLTNEQSDGEIAAVLSSIRDPQEAANQLVRAAREHGGSDNVTVVVVDVVVGESDSDSESIPAVLPVAAGFFSSASGAPARSGRASRSGGVDTGTDGRQVVAPPTGTGGVSGSKALNSREHHRSRGRRLITVRTVIVVVVVAAVIYGAFYAVRWYNNNSYYVRAQGNQLVIYQGRIGGFLWYRPVVVERTGVTTNDVPPPYRSSVQNGVQESSLTNARMYVQNLVAAHESRANSHDTVPAVADDYHHGADDCASDNSHHHPRFLMERRIRQLGCSCSCASLRCS